MRVLVNAVSARVGGGGSHTLAQMEALSSLPFVDVTVHIGGELADRLRAAAPNANVISHPRRALLYRVLWEQIVLAWASRRYDVVYLLGNFAIALSRAPQVLVAQNTWYFGKAARDFRRDSCPRPLRLRLFVEGLLALLSIRRATRVVAVSEAMAASIVSEVGPMDSLQVVASAAPDLGAVPPAAPLVPVPREFILAVAHDDPHKEWDRLFELFSLRKEIPPLVLVGRSRRLATLRRASARDARITLLGEVSDPRVLGWLYRNASLYLAHSRFESFGLTPAEALQFGTPVAASDIAAHREACGDAAAYYAPDSDRAMAEAVAASLGAPRAEPARAPALRRSWRDNALELGRVLQEAAGAS